MAWEIWHFCTYWDLFLLPVVYSLVHLYMLAKVGAPSPTANHKLYIIDLNTYIVTRLLTVHYSSSISTTKKTKDIIIITNSMAYETRRSNAACSRFSNNSYPISPGLILIGLKSILILSYHLRPGLPNDLFPVGLTNYMAYETRMFNVAITRFLQ